MDLLRECATVSSTLLHLD